MGELCPVGQDTCMRKPYVQDKNGFEVIKVTADLGAVDHVAPKDIAKRIPVRETKASRQGVHYVAANGTSIRNEGENRIKAFTEDNKPMEITWQIAGVKKPLASIGRICDAGNVAVFTDKGGYIIGRGGSASILSAVERHQGSKMRMIRENGVYNFTMRVPTKEVNGVDVYNRFGMLQEEGDVQDNSQAFGRQGIHLL